MSPETKALAYSPLLWGITITTIGLLVFLATVYLKKAIKTAKIMGVTDSQIKDTIKTSAISSIGPSFVIMVGMVALLALVGAPTAWMRLSVIGDIAQETIAVAFVADAYGVPTTASSITPNMLQTATFLMASACIGYLLFPAVFCSQFEKLISKIGASKGGNLKMAALSTAAILGCYAYVEVPYVLAGDASTVALITGFVAMLALDYIQEKFNVKWLLSWGFLIAMFIGMFAGVLAA